MAIYKGREVQVLGRSDGADVSPMYDILDQWNERSSVKFNELEFSSKEIEDMKKQHVSYFEHAKTIKSEAKPVVKK